MLTSVVVTSINHVLRGESWACKRLVSYAGKKVCIRARPFLVFNFIIEANGEVASIANNVDADTTLTLAPVLLPQLLAHDESALKNIKVSGDSDLASELIIVMKNLDLNFEQDLSTIIGDIPARRFVQAKKSLSRWHTRGIQNISQALVEYWVEERPTLAKPTHFNQLIHDVNELNAHAEALELRIIKITDKILF